MKNQVLASLALSALVVGCTAPTGDAGADMGTVSGKGDDGSGAGDNVLAHKASGSSRWVVPTRHTLNRRVAAGPNPDSSDVGGVEVTLDLEGHEAVYWDLLGQASANPAVEQEVFQDLRAQPTNRHGDPIQRNHHVAVDRTFVSEISNELTSGASDMFTLNVRTDQLARGYVREFNRSEDEIDELVSRMGHDGTEVSLEIQKQGLTDWRDAFPMTVAVDRALADTGLVSVGESFMIRAETDDGEQRFEIELSCPMEETTCFASIELLVRDCPTDDPNFQCEYVAEPDAFNRFVSLYADGVYSLCDGSVRGCTRWQNPAAEALMAANHASLDILLQSFPRQQDEVEMLVQDRANTSFTDLADLESYFTFNNYEDDLLHARNLMAWPYTP
jgi:hypothetical protein